MSDLISRSALMEALMKEEKEYEDCMIVPSWETALRVINNQPTVELPVVKGEWKYDWLGEYICSNCHERVRVKEVMCEPTWDWCPECGADMRGEKHD